MTKRLSGRDRVAAAAEAAGWTLVADGTIGVDHYRLGHDNVFVSHSVIGAVTWVSTSTSIIGVRTVGKADWAVDYFRTHAAHPGGRS